MFPAGIFPASCVTNITGNYEEIMKSVVLFELFTGSYLWGNIFAPSFRSPARNRHQSSRHDF